MKHRLLDQTVDEEIKDIEDDLAQMKGPLRRQMGLGVDDAAERAKYFNRFNTVARFDNDRKRLMAYKSAINTLEEIVTKGGMERRSEFLADDEFGFMR